MHFKRDTYLTLFMMLCVFNLICVSIIDLEASSSTSEIREEFWVPDLDKGGKNSDFALSYNQHKALLNAVINNRSLDMKECLANGANSKVRLGNGKTLLHVAVIKDSYECFKVLLEEGVDVNVVDSRNLSALHYAAELSRDNALKKLIKAGAVLQFDEPHESESSLVKFIKANIFRSVPEQEVRDALQRQWSVIHSLGIVNSLPPYVIVEINERQQQDQYRSCDMALILEYCLERPEENIFFILLDDLMKTSFSRAAILLKNRKEFKKYFLALLAHARNQLSKFYLDQLKRIIIRHKKSSLEVEELTVNDLYASILFRIGNNVDRLGLEIAKNLDPIAWDHAIERLKLCWSIDFD